MDKQVINILFNKIRKLEKEIKELKEQNTKNPQTVLPSFSQNSDGTYTMKYSVNMPISVPFPVNVFSPLK